MAGPEGGRSRRARLFRAALPCLALIALTGTAAQAQTVTSDLFSPMRASCVTAADSPLRRTAAEANDPLNSPKLQDSDKDKPAPSRIGQIPKYGLPAASGASTSGYDSLNRKRTKPKFYPGQAKPKALGPGNRAAPVTSPAGANRTRAAVGAAVGDRQQGAAAARDGRHGGRTAAAQAAEDR